MGVKSNFFTAKYMDGEYDRKYSSAALNGRFASYFSTGIHVPETGILGDQLMVEPAGGMNIQINVGTAEGMEGHQISIYDEPYIITLPAADPTYTRYDNIVLECNLSDDVRDFSPRYVAGTPSENPAAPEVIRNNTIGQLVLARVRVRAGATEITAEDITDTRTDDLLCGISNVRLGVKVPVGGGDVIGPETSTAGRMAVFDDGGGNRIREATDDEDNGWRPVYDLVYDDGEYYVPGDQKNKYKPGMYVRLRNLNATYPAGSGGVLFTDTVYGVVKGAIYEAEPDNRTLLIINWVTQIEGEEPYFLDSYQLGAFETAHIALRGKMPVDFPDVVFKQQYSSEYYTVQLRDAGCLLEMIRPAMQYVTVPTDDTVPFQVGTGIEFKQVGEGQISISAADSNVTVYALNGSWTAGPGSLAMLLKTGPNEWHFFGQVTDEILD